MIVAVGLNVVVGLAGLLDLGYVGFFAIGAYSVALFGSPSSPVAKAIAASSACPTSWAVAVRACIPIAIALTHDLRRDPRRARPCGCAATTWPS